MISPFFILIQLLKSTFSKNQVFSSIYHPAIILYIELDSGQILAPSKVQFHVDNDFLFRNEHKTIAVDLCSFSAHFHKQFHHSF